MATTSKRIKGWLTPQRSFLLFSGFVLLLASFLLFRRASVFIVLLIATSAVVYGIYRLRLPFDPSPVLVLSLAVSYSYTPLLGIIFAIISGFLPMLIAGGSVDHTTIFYLCLICGANLLLPLFGSFLWPAIALMVLHHLLGSLFAANTGVPWGKELISFSLKVCIDGFYLLKFSEVVLALLR